ncbi:MAG: LemA family protein, partial [Phycisphaeraceae bacterium]|nr:LemA family protein [Phycisphaeraceae bacterium]
AEIVRTYASHEEEIQKQITEMRTQSAGGRRVPDDDEAQAQIEAANNQTAALGRLFAVVENYPDLKADGQFKKLHDSIVDTEDRVALARGFFNDSVTAYNDRIGTLPDLLFARIFSFHSAPLFQIKAFERENVSVADEMN